MRSPSREGLARRSEGLATIPTGRGRVVALQSMNTDWGARRYRRRSPRRRCPPLGRSGGERREDWGADARDGAARVRSGVRHVETFPWRVGSGLGSVVSRGGDSRETAEEVVGLMWWPTATPQASTDVAALGEVQPGWYRVMVGTDERHPHIACCTLER